MINCLVLKHTFFYQKGRPNWREKNKKNFFQLLFCSFNCWNQMAVLNMTAYVKIDSHVLSVFWSAKECMSEFHWTVNVIIMQHWFSTVWQSDCGCWPLPPWVAVVTRGQGPLSSWGEGWRGEVGCRLPQLVQTDPPKCLDWKGTWGDDEAPFSQCLTEGMGLL